MATNVRFRTILSCFFTAVLMIAAAGVRLSAQTTTATILGTVTDPSGAAIPDATVRATNTETGVGQSAMSDSQGRYRIPELAVGEYEVQTEKMGFQTVLHKAIRLTVGGESVVDFALPVGQVAQTITVEGEVSQVETTSSQISSLVEQTQIRELPLNGRNFEQLVLLAPGVLTFTNVVKGLFYGNSNAFSVSGSRPNGQAELLDDTDVQDFENRGSGAGVLGTSMGVDAIAEFQTLTNTYGAQFGGNGSVVNEVSKSGTNNIHGSAYEFVRNSALDASNFFDTANGGKKPHFSRNQFGGTIGGPIKKDKMFFFANYEGLRQDLGETFQYTVLDNNARHGIINGVSVCSSTPTAACSNPVSVPGGTGFVNANILPYLQFYSQNVPLPATSSPTTGTGSIVETGSQPGTENYVLARYDWTISAKDSFFGRYLGDVASIVEPFAGAFNLWPADERNHNQYGVAEEKHIFSTSVINSARFAYSRPLQELHTPISVPLFQFYPGAGLVDGRIVVTGLTSPFGGGIRQSPLRIVQNKYAVGDDVLWTKGSHNLRFGASLTRIQTGAIQNAPGGGEWQFNSVSLFLQGTAAQITGPVPGGITLTNGNALQSTNGQRDFRESDYAVYVQDDWKVRPSITLNIGLRYAPTSTPYCLLSTSACSAIIPLPFGLGSTGAITTGFTQVHNVFATNPSFRNFDPRIGIAWDPFKDHKTSIRAGYGIFHAVVAARDYEPEYCLTPPFALATQLNPLFPNISGTPTYSLSNGYNYNIGTTPYFQQWNLTVQREVMKNTVVSLGYVGSHGVHLLSPNDENPPTFTTDPANGNMVFSTLQTVNGKTSIVSNPLINPNFNFISQDEAFAWSTYNALQAGLIRRLTGNLQFQISYTYSECVDLGSGSFALEAGGAYENPYNPGLDRGYCAFQVRNNLVANGLYQLPFHGHRYSEGWQMSGIFTYRNGVPVNVTDGFVQAFQNSGTANRPNFIPTAAGCNGDPVFSSPLSNSQATANKGGVFWINPACFSIPPVGELGNVGRDSIIGPGAVELDTAITKNTKINERFGVQFRAEFFNILNNVNFGQPSGGMFTQQTVSGNATGGANISTTGGKITATNTTSRQIQFGVKIIF